MEERDRIRDGVQKAALAFVVLGVLIGVLRPTGVSGLLLEMVAVALLLVAVVLGSMWLWLRFGPAGRA